MSTTLEIEGKNVDQAVQKACQRFNLSPGELKYDILSYGSSGIFGLGRTRKARIRVRMNLVDVTADNVRGDATLEKSPEPGIGRQSPVPAHAEMPLSKSVKSAEPGNPVGAGKEVLQRIVDTITDNARIDVDTQPERVVFRIEGDNAAILIGKHGQTLEAMQSLIDKVVNKHNSHRIRVQVDVGNYMQNRKKRLIRNAQRLAQKCTQTKKPVSAGLLNAYDRRIVHIALKDNNSVQTRSTGDGLLRNLMILPRKTTGSGQRRC
ncbi:MAG: hypothetical protein AMJ54_07145 [Deltaproteobacteria bacterium SG8_13]|nr:MAG: hypothetical protein AMJ54_07145 [Deltaproteobacteria bacterium SG8_13]